MDVSGQFRTVTSLLRSDCSVPVVPGSYAESDRPLAQVRRPDDGRAHVRPHVLISAEPFPVRLKYGEPSPFGQLLSNHEAIETRLRPDSRLAESNGKPSVVRGCRRGE